MARIYFYETLDGRILEESEDSAWRVHVEFLKKHHKYLGWSDGRFIQAVKPQADKDEKTGIQKQVSAEVREQLLKAREQEIEFARNNKDRTPPKNHSKKEFAGIHGSVTDVFTPGIIR